MVIVAGLVFSILQFGESKRSNTSANTSASKQKDPTKPKSPSKSGINTTQNQLSALSRLLFVVFDTQPIISVAIYVAFIINAPGLLDATGSLSNYHLRVSVHLQALSGIQLVAPLVLVFGSTRRRLLRFIWFEIHLVFFIGLSSVQILLQKDAAQSILPLEREAQCFEKGTWASRNTSYATGVATLTAYLVLVCVAVAHMLLTTRAKYQKVPKTEKAVIQAKSRARVRFIAEVVIFAYLIAFAVSQIFIVQSLRKEYRKVWGDEENTWGFGQVLALVTLIPAIIDYLEAIVRKFKSTPCPSLTN
jgi:hypothetical protein